MTVEMQLLAIEYYWRRLLLVAASRLHAINFPTY